MSAFESGSEVWVREETSVWEKATVIGRGDDGKLVQVATAACERSVAITDIMPREDSAAAEKPVQDLTELTHLNEPSILHALASRFADSAIYTSCGPVLIAVNPFQRLLLYTEEILSDYRANGLLRATEENGALEHVAQLPPHVFATADAAYRCMMDDDPSFGLVCRNQSVLVSGESGAGKTETTKLVLRYLSAVGRPKATIAGEHGPRPHLGTLPEAHPHAADAASAGTASASASTVAKRPSVEKAVLQSNPVLEALGNAKTTRNENSSRFGKFIVMQFNAAGVLGGASVNTYLLEKVRLVRQASGERNYHIFYQLHAGLPDKTVTSLQLRGVDQHALTRESGTYDLRGVSDADIFGETVSAMTTMGLGDSQQGRLWRVLAGLLHLGDITYDADSGSSAAASGTSEGSRMAASAIESAKTAARLLGFLGEEGDLRHGADAIGSALTGKSIKVGMDKIRTLFSPAQAHSATMSLIKDIYGKVFEWLVRRVNERIQAGGMGRAELFIGVLDIFGFEHFEHNSFEQLCINFANEQLQQHFNAFMFKLEQEEYQREGIDWSDIQFVDNQDCLDLIEGRKPPGILALVDEQCSLMPKAPKGGDKRTEEEKSQELAAKLIAKLNETLGSSKGRVGAEEGHARFLCTPKMQRDSCFVVRHYAGEVEYECIGFVEKNADQVHAEALALARESTNPVVYDAYREAEEAEEEAAAAAAASGSGAGRRKKQSSKETVGGQFKRQLVELMRVVRATTPHYIRCIKPNSDQVPVKLERTSVVSQLRCGGVLEAVRVARLGFPVRLPHHKLLLDYAALSPVDSTDDGHNDDAAAASTTEVVTGRRVAEGPGSRAITLRKLVHKATAEELDGAHDDEDGVYDQDLADAAAQTAQQLRDVLQDEASILLSGLSILERGTYQVGITKVFLRKSAFDALQTALNEANAEHAITMQCAWRVAAASHEGNRRRAALLTVQCAWRSRQARIAAQLIRQTKAAICMASFAKMLTAKLSFLRIRQGATLLRAQYLRRKQRAWYLEERRRLAVTRLQAWHRSTLSRAWFLQQRQAAVTLQCFARVNASKIRLELLKKEAREVGNLRETNVVLRQRSRALEGKVTALVDMLKLQLGAKRIEWGRQALPGGDALSSSAREQDPSDAEAEEDEYSDDDGTRAAAMPSGFAVVMPSAGRAVAHADVTALAMVDLARALREASARANAALDKYQAATTAEHSDHTDSLPEAVSAASAMADSDKTAKALAEIEQLRKQLRLERAALRQQQKEKHQQQSPVEAASTSASSEAPLGHETAPGSGVAITSEASKDRKLPGARTTVPVPVAVAVAVAVEEEEYQVTQKLQQELDLARKTIAAQQEDMAAWQQRVAAAERRAAEVETQEAGNAARANQAEAAAKTAAVADPARLAAEQRQEFKLRQAQSQAKSMMMQLTKVETELAGVCKQAKQDRLAKAELARKLADLQRQVQSSQEDTVRMYQGELDKLTAVCNKARDRYSRANSAALKMQEALREAQARAAAITTDHATLKATISSLEDDLNSHKQQRSVDKRSKRMLIERADSALATQMATADKLHTAELRIEQMEHILARRTTQAAAMEDLLRAHGIELDAAVAASAGDSAAEALERPHHAVPEMSPMVSTKASSQTSAVSSLSATAPRKPSRLGVVASVVSTESQASDASAVSTPGGTKKRRKRNKKKPKNHKAAESAAAPGGGRAAGKDLLAAVEDDDSAMTAITGVFSSALKAGLSLFSSPASTPAAPASSRPRRGRGQKQG